MLFDDIEVLLVLSKAKSLSQAANQLYMSRPGLSQKITNIEKRFGASLINRTSTGISLTQAGKVAVKFAQNMADMERVMASQIAAIDEHFPANVTVGMSLADGVTLLPRLVAQYVKEQPDARVHPLEPGIVTEVLGYKKLVFLAPDKAPYNQMPGPVPIDTLLKWPMIVYEWHSGRHMVGNRHFRERYGLSLRDHNMVGCFDTHEAMIEGVKAGLGWATLPECIANRYRNEPGIIRFKVATDTIWYPVSLTWPSSCSPSDEARDFANFVRENIPEGYFANSTEAQLRS